MILCDHDLFALMCTRACNKYESTVVSKSSINYKPIPSTGVNFGAIAHETIVIIAPNIF